jgi:aspartate/methionine/tyrosine aminotransferase
MALLQSFLATRQDLECVVPRSGTVAFPRVVGLASTARFTERLFRERETAVVPGHFFDAPAHMRIGVSAATETLEAGLAHLAAALDARDPG